MKPYLTPRQFAKVTATAVIALAIALAVLQSRRSEDAALVTPTEANKAGSPESELARCRTISPDDVGLLEPCRQIWAANRQNFFLSTKLPSSPTADAPLAPATKRDGTSSRDIDQSRAH